MEKETPRILVVDDDRKIREMLELNLSLRGFEVRCAADGAAALPIVREWTPSVIVLDIMMPKIDGISLLPMLRRLTEAPILLLSARGEVVDKVEGLQRGADDYLAKPFEISELIARLESALRRPRLIERRVLAYADLSVDLDAYTVKRGSVLIGLTALEFRLLATLLRAPGRVFTRDQLFDLVWEDRSDAEIGSVERTISYLRSKIDRDFQPRLIHTVRGVGYVLKT
ncbi:MAG TPA: response regulator transcription factor [Candidatus Baltobacteraceae bacterium]|jgi:DNA-binding response OmpR family regulator|nr:response regulator transcription factor [Candidatus Baltobacteraceae bacterium]